MRRGAGAELVEQGAHAGALEAGVVQDGGASADGGVLRFDLGSAAFCDEGCEETLEGKGDEVAVGEEPVEEVMDFWDLRRVSGRKPVLWR